MNFQIDWNIFWAALSAIATFMAVFVALFQNRRKISLQIVVSSISAPIKTARLVITNEGNNSEAIIRILYKKKGEKKRRELIQAFVLPKILQAHEIWEQDVPYLTNPKHDLEEICAEDSLGNLWKCKKRNFERATKLLKYYEGSSALVYGSKNEDKI